MTTIIDTAKLYTTIYTKCDAVKRDCKQKEETILGQRGKKIKLEEVGLSLSVASKGATATATVTVDYNGTEKTIATWTETKTEYQSKIQKLDIIAPEGRNVIIRYYLKTSNEKIRAMMSRCSFSYSIIEEPVEPPEEPEDHQVLLVISCSSAAADTLIETLETVTQDITAYKKV